MEDEIFSSFAISGGELRHHCCHDVTGRAESYNQLQTFHFNCKSILHPRPSIKAKLEYKAETVNPMTVARVETAGRTFLSFSL